MANKPKVVIGMAATDIVRARTAHAIGCAVIASKGLVVDFLLKQSCELASARTWLVQEALKNGATHLLFWDSDIVPVNTKEGEEFNFIEKMLAHKKPIVGVQYNKRMFPLEPVYKSHHQEWQDKVSETELFEAQFAATGLMLIDLSIFKEEWIDPQTGRKAPWFAFGRDSQGALTLGEDAWFCCTARDNGHSTFIDPTIKTLHCGEYLY
jgi:hypothetical protein